MAILLTNDFPPVHGGIQRLMSRLADELALQHGRVSVIAPCASRSNEFDKVQRYRVRRFAKRGRLDGFLSMAICFLRARLERKHSVTIASTWFPGGLIVSLLPRRLAGRLAILAHGSEIAPHRKGLRLRLMRFSFSRADVIIANSQFTRSLLLQAGIREHFVAVVSPGIDARPILPARSADPTILSVGRLVPRKGFDVVISAMPKILKKFPHARYQIVGAGPQSDELKSLASRLQVEDHVDFLGAVNDAALQDAYARAWIFALPVRAVGNDVEGFGLVYLEAALARLPSIGGRASGAEDAIVTGETGLLVDGTSSEEFGEAALQLLENKELADAMGARALERALTFTWKRAALEVSRLANIESSMNEAP